MANLVFLFMCVRRGSGDSRAFLCAGDLATRAAAVGRKRIPGALTTCDNNATTRERAANAGLP